MKKLFLMAGLLPTMALACPYLEGRYPDCHSEIKQMKGEYVINQSNENGIEVYSIKYIDENGDVQEDQFKTDGSKTTRKQTIPTVGVKVKVEGSATCNDDKVLSKGKAYFMGANVGNFNSTIYKDENGVLTMKIAASYLGRDVNKLIQCKE